MRRIYLLRSSLLVLFALFVALKLCWATSWGQVAPAEHPPLQTTVTSPTKLATCYDRITGKVTGTMLVRRPTLASPNGKWQAYAVIKAVSEHGGCESTSRLFVRSSGEKQFHPVLVQKPKADQLLNDIRLIDWSRDSHYLLIDLVLGQWGSDAGGTVPLVYDAWKGTFWQRAKVRNAVHAQAGKLCDFYAASIGFAPDDGVVLRIRPVFEIEGPLERNSCVNKAGLWLLNNGLEPLPENYHVRQYGRLLAAPLK